MTPVPRRIGMPTHRIGDLLAGQARERPTATAVVHDGGSVTFAELDARASAVAGLLRGLGVEPQEPVGLFVEPSAELMAATWGTLLAGAAYLPLAPDYPDERLRYMIENSGTRTVLAQPDLHARLAELAPRTTRIVAPTQPPPAGAEPGPAAEPAPHHLAYVIYTSGSTGAPKGVQVEHRGVLNQLRWLHAAHGIGPDRRVLQKTPLSFDAAQWEVLAAGLGATVVMAPPGAHRDPHRLLDTIIGHRVTTLQCVPTLLRALLDTGRLAECGSLTQVFSGGEVLPRDLARRVLDQLPGAELVNLYGPTECTINTSAFTVDRRAATTGPDAVPIGRPVPGVSYHILDERGRPVAAGEVGELHIGGVQLARGYLGRPDLTAQRFVPGPTGTGRLFRTGDLAHHNADGTVQFAGRTDNQVKLRGYRVELDEIRLRIEAHEWVRHAAVVVTDDPRTGFAQLVAHVELNPREAALMDQGSHGGHHLSKESRLQVRAQLAGLGSRDPAELAPHPAVELPPAPGGLQRRQAFTRKTYRFYEGGPARAEHILRALDRAPASAGARHPGELDLAELGEILRYLEPHHSDQRLLPKYGYASPGALYATQLYLRLDGIAGLPSGVYYHHAAAHRLVRLRDTATGPRGRPSAELHFVGRRRAIEPVYKNNIREVLEIEAGHMVGLLEQVLPGHGLGIEPADHRPEAITGLGCAEEDHFLGTFRLTPGTGAGTCRPDDDTEIYVQAHPDRVVDLPGGLYRYRAGGLHRIGDDTVLRRHVIAINQEVYDRAAFGITAVSTGGPDRLAYLNLGRTLQRLAMNDQRLGFMAAGYSSRTGHDLPAARRMRRLLGTAGPCYFVLGGRVSAEQWHAEDMKEDAVHMRGPSEMIRDDLAAALPDYMVPNRVVVLDRLPQSPNGKVDTRELLALEAASAARARHEPVAPRTTTERRVARLWGRATARETVSVRDDFFASGGNSLIAVGLVNALNAELGTSLPVQVIFEHPTVERLARLVDRGPAGGASRLVPLANAGAGRPIFCWPGLGGYPMNLRTLAGRLRLERPCYGVQARGINAGETPHPDIERMAASDVELIRRQQPAGPYTLWGYSFGARPAFEAAHLLERAGERVDHLFLIAPGSPTVPGTSAGGSEPDFADPHFATILFSVFAGVVAGPLVDELRREVRDEDGFVRFVTARFGGLDGGLVRRVTRVVRQTYRFRYSFEELSRRRIEAPITLFKARGDDYSFLENAHGYSARRPDVVDLDGDHYGILRDPGVDLLVDAIERRVRDGAPTRRDPAVPHVSIGHHPVAPDAELLKG
ncbi:amino acid adenylation domain-containing protein [Pseudonocardia acaciae]|uniref:amino acid adenylation domain-containing protein n=1 Tax=Pseudonocardia acaciae TaxID=551276 RepID=UPI000ADD1E45|nr:amino acid adenylation domain-containing protein [Pseudonocardia acaciae]